MKRIIYYLIILIGIFTPIFVFAEEYQTMKLIPVDTSATVSTDKFTYQDFMYNSNVDGNGNTIISFGSITNNTISKLPVSINVLLFDTNQKNIGIVTYCSNKDYGNNYEGFKLNGKQSAAFSIKVTNNKYFVKDKGTRDVKYIAVMDENKYCKVGGYSNYEGLTIDEISNGIYSNNKSSISLSRYIEEFKESGIMGMIIPIAIVLVSLIVFGTILNALYSKMYSKTTILSYVPITNVFIAFQLAFGKIVAFVGVLLFMIAVGITFLGINIGLYIVSGLVGIAFLVVIIKLITKKYDLFYLEPSIKTNTVIDNNVDNSNVDENNTQEALDLSYGNADDVSLGDVNDNSVFNVSSGDVKEESNNTSLEDDVVNNNEDDDNNDGGSDLTNFFG